MLQVCDLELVSWLRQIGRGKLQLQQNTLRHHLGNLHVHKCKLTACAFLCRPHSSVSMCLHVSSTLPLYVHETGVCLPTLSRSARFSWTMGTSM